jgi:hypothetical protein
MSLPSLFLIDVIGNTNDEGSWADTWQEIPFRFQCVHQNAGHARPMRAWLFVLAGDTRDSALSVLT